MQPFKYKPLTGDNSIRLLKLSPRGGSTLKGSLLEVNMDNRPVYEAVSYTWGGEALSQTLVCDGREIKITPNCEAMLRHVRRTLLPRTLWVDIICIDQSSVAERNQQVSMMDRIYSQTQRTLVWLREGNDQSDAAIEILEYLALAPIMPQKWGDQIADLQLGRGKKSPAGPAVDKKPVRDALFALFDQPWFSRTWTLQEVALAPKSVVLCGKKSIGWSVLELALATWQNKHHDNPYMSAPAEVMAIFSLHRELARSVHAKLGRKNVVSSNWWSSLTYVELLSQVRYKNVTDPRDKIFGLTGIAKMLDMPVVEPDYADSCTPQQVYHAAARLALTTKDGLDILYHVGRRTLSDLPSWVPDLSCQRRFAVDPKNFDASKHNEPFYKVSSHGRSLYCRSVLVDTVTSVAARSLTFDYNGDDTVHPFQPLMAWSDLANLFQTYPTGEEVQAVFCKTLIHDTFEEAIRTSNEYNRTIEELGLGELTGISDRFVPKQPAIDYVKAFRLFMSALIEDDYGCTNRPGVSLDERLSEPSSDKGGSTAVMSTGELLDIKAYASNVRLASAGKTFFVTEKGYMGSTLPGVRAGDQIILIAGLKVPFIIRQREGEHRTYQLFSSAFIHGMMYGELWPDVEESGNEGGPSSEPCDGDLSPGRTGQETKESKDDPDSNLDHEITSALQVEGDHGHQTLRTRLHPQIETISDRGSRTSWDSECNDELRIAQARQYFARFATEGQEVNPVHLMAQAYLSVGPVGLDYASEEYQKAASELLRPKEVVTLKFI